MEKILEALNNRMTEIELHIEELKINKVGFHKVTQIAMMFAEEELLLELRHWYKRIKHESENIGKNKL